MIGIDKTKIKAFKINMLDKTKLLSNQNVICHEKAPFITIKDINGNDNNISYLKITDGYMFNSLVLGIKINKNIPNKYNFIEIHISEKNDNNLNPLNISEYHNLLNRLKKYLEERYGLYIDFSKSKFEEIEINITNKMDLAFTDYEYLLKQMIYLVPKIYSINQNIKKDRTINQFEFHNKSVEGKIYDKTRQLLEKFKIKLNNQYMRIEYKLNKPSKIKSCLKTEYIYKIKDIDIQEWIIQQINKDLLKPINKHIKKSDAILLNIAKEEKKLDARKWTKPFLYRAMAFRFDSRTGEIPAVTDIKQIKNIITKLSSKANIKRSLKRLDSAFKKYPYAENNFSKLEEITNKFSKLNG